MKTNKSFAKRLKITKNGKILARKKGQNHYNAKDRHPTKSAKGKSVEFKMTAKEKSRFLPHSK